MITIEVIGLDLSSMNTDAIVHALRSHDGVPITADDHVDIIAIHNGVRSLWTYNDGLIHGPSRLPHQPPCQLLEARECAEMWRQTAMRSLHDLDEPDRDARVAQACANFPLPWED